VESSRRPIRNGVPDTTDTDVLRFDSASGQCTATLVCGNTALTAGHCIHAEDPKEWRFTPDLSTYTAAFRYAQLGGQGGASDLGVVRLSGELSYAGEVLAQDEVPPSDVPNEGAPALVTGWGQYVDTATGTYESGGTRRRVGYMLYQGIDLFTHPSTLIFTPDPAANSSPCHGDSGGPWRYNGQVIGVVSAGDLDNCATVSTSWAAPVGLAPHPEWLAKRISAFCNAPGLTVVVHPPDDYGVNSVKGTVEASALADGPSTIIGSSTACLSDGGIACRSVLLPGDTVTLTAYASSDWTFTGWVSGAVDRQCGCARNEANLDTTCTWTVGNDDGEQVCRATYCKKATCAAGACGMTSNGCDGMLDCGSCPDGQSCYMYHCQ
jgi:hypothetical protein